MPDDVEHQSRTLRRRAGAFALGAAAVIPAAWISGVLPWALSPAASDPCRGSSGAIVVSCPSSAPVLVIAAVLVVSLGVGSAVDWVIRYA